MLPAPLRVAVPTPGTVLSLILTPERAGPVSVVASLVIAPRAPLIVAPELPRSGPACALTPLIVTPELSRSGAASPVAPIVVASRLSRLGSTRTLGTLVVPRRVPIRRTAPRSVGPAASLVPSVTDPVRGPPAIAGVPRTSSIRGAVAGLVATDRTPAVFPAVVAGIPLRRTGCRAPGSTVLPSVAGGRRTPPAARAPPSRVPTGCAGVATTGTAALPAPAIVRRTTACAGRSTLGAPSPLVRTTGRPGPSLAGRQTLAPGSATVAAPPAVRSAARGPAGAAGTASALLAAPPRRVGTVLAITTPLPAAAPGAASLRLTTGGPPLATAAFRSSSLAVGRLLLVGHPTKFASPPAPDAKTPPWSSLLITTGVFECPATS